MPACRQHLRQRYTQNVLRAGVVEFAFGEPDPALLPVGLVREAAAGALDRFGPGAISYGQVEGPPALREQIARRIAAREGRDVAAADILVSGGNSQALDQALTVLTDPATSCSWSRPPTASRCASSPTTRCRSSACRSTATAWT